MSATNKGSILQTLELDAAIIESLSEPVLSELIGFIEYDNQLARRDRDVDDRDVHDHSPREMAYCRAAGAWPDS